MLFMEQKLLSRSADETEYYGSALAQGLQPGSVIALFGGLGAGKTAFVRGLARGLGVTGEICSPTYALVHEHPGNPALIHFDMYRIEGPDGLESTGWFDYLGRGCVIAVEWSENIIGELPENAMRVRITPGEGENERYIMIEGAGQ